MPNKSNLSNDSKMSSFLMSHCVFFCAQDIVREDPALEYSCKSANEVLAQSTQLCGPKATRHGGRIGR